ncbi:MAG: ABC transporter permease [Cyclobacteriaceae bacterium]|nr:ABC transporter permease [Cyclobacteriaceae bacterium]
MIKNILITSLRNFFRNRIFSLINLIGLSVSMSLGMLIIMIIKDQFAFDNFHKDSDRIYRVNTLLLHPEWGTVDFASAPLSVGRTLKDDYSFSENTVRINRELNGDATYMNVNVPVKGLLVDPSFLEVFNFPFQKGNPATALALPNSLVLTKQTAEKIFGTTDPIGQTISIARYGDFTITGVLQEFASKTHFEFEVLCSISTLPVLEKNKAVSHSLDNWSAYYNNYVYIKLKDGRNADEAEQALAEINRKHCIGLKSQGQDIEYSFYLQPLEKITPGPELSGQMGKGMPAFFLIFLGVLAGVVLLMSVFNFTNLTIAKSLSRAREIGVRKVVGANRRQVFFQFMGEAVIFSLAALSFSYILLQFLKTSFLQLSLNEDFFMELNEGFSLYIIFILFATGVGILAGVLPAAYLSAFKPSRVLKDVQNLKIYSRLTFRKILMVVQFTLSVIFVIVVLVVYRQIDFMLTSDYGIEQKNNLHVSLQGVAFEKIANEIRSLPGVVRVGGVSHKLGTFQTGSGNYRKSEGDKSFVMHNYTVDDNYIENLSLTFLAGRNFNPDEQVGHEKHVILNETALDRFGFQYPLDAIGQNIYAVDSLALQIIGVVKDFHFRPMNNKIGPLALRYNINELNYLSAKIYAEQKEAVTASIAEIWKKHDPIHPVEFMMMEDEIDDEYRQAGMNDVLVIVGYITFLVISLACLGMLGMAMYASRIRVKEVGIRKVMGATVTDMVMLLSKSYMILIGIAILIGVPVSFILGEVFLEGFAYKIQITPLLLGFSIAIIAGMGLLTIWSQTIIVALSNPVKWLRHE